MKKQPLLKLFIALLFAAWSGSSFADIPGNVWFTISNRFSGLALDISGQSTDVGGDLIQWQQTGGYNQQFRFLDSGNGYYRIQVRHTSMVLDVYAKDTSNGASIVQWTDNNGSNQQWKVERNGDGYYTISNRLSGKALDVWQWSSTAGDRISQYDSTGATNQQWALLPADTDLTVAQDGSGDYSSVQSAINAASNDDSILIKPGTYNEHLDIASSKSNITLIGSTGNAADVVLTDSRCNSCSDGNGSTWGTSGSATAMFFGADLYVRDLTIQNGYDEDTYGSSQAVALYARGDRQIYENVRLIGNQDTVLTWTANTSTIARQYFRDCYVEGDVDFIFGRGTAVFDRCEIHSLNRGSSSNNGYLTAASTEITNPYGILFNQCTITSDAAAGTVYLGRPWPAGNSSTAIAQVLFRDSWLSDAIRADAWTDMMGLSWEDARLSEYNNSGPGALINSNRPQMSSSDVADYTVEKYMAGSDSWNPVY